MELPQSDFKKSQEVEKNKLDEYDLRFPVCLIKCFRLFGFVQDWRLFGGVETTAGAEEIPRFETKH